MDASDVSLWRLVACNNRNRCLTSTRFRLVKSPASSPAINSSAVASRSGGSTEGVPYCANTCVKGTTATNVLTTNQDTMMVRDRLRRLIVLYMLSRRHASAVLHGSVHAAGILRGQHKTSVAPDLVFLERPLAHVYCWTSTTYPYRCCGTLYHVATPRYSGMRRKTTLVTTMLRAYYHVWSVTTRNRKVSKVARAVTKARC
jgi:hypothetical protein